MNALNAGTGPSPSQPVVVKISPMAHLGVGFFTLAAMSLVLADPRMFIAILILPAFYLCWALTGYEPEGEG